VLRVQPLEEIGRVGELLVLDQPLHQVFPGRLGVVRLVLLFLGPGKQGSGLYEEQGGGDEQELRGKVEVEPRGALDEVIMAMGTSCMSNSCFIMSWSRRSNGPSNTSIFTSKLKRDS